MNIRTSIRRHVASATAALAVSAIFITAAAGPVALQSNAPASTQLTVA